MVGTELLDHVPQGCLVVSEDGKVLFWNRVLELWTGIDRSAVVGHVIYDAFPRLGEPQDRSRCDLAFYSLVSSPVSRSHH